jgi:hypothetical protein
MVSLIDPQTTEKITWWLGETKGFWIQTGALIISAIGGLLIIRSRSKTERRRATVDLVLHQKNDNELMEAKRHLLKLHDDGTKNFAIFLNQKESPEYKAIIKVLNTHEFVCCGIREKAYDEKLFKRMQCSCLIRDWDALCGFVTEFRNSLKGRTNNPKTFYQEFQWIAEKWKKDPLKPTSSWWFS